jgi:hypothetical protein
MEGMRRLTLAVLGLLAFGCGDSPSPTTPSNPVTSSVVFTATSPPSGSVVLLPESYPYIIPGGVVIPPGSGHISIGLTLTSAHDVPWAQLSVYLLTAEPGLGYCGQNTPDSPTWQFLTPGWRTSYSVSGFRVYRVPCDVTGIRAMLHMRNNGTLTPPTASETIAEATFPLSLQIRR